MLLLFSSEAITSGSRLNVTLTGSSSQDKLLKFRGTTNLLFSFIILVLHQSPAPPKGYFGARGRIECGVTEHGRANYNTL